MLRPVNGSTVEVVDPARSLTTWFVLCSVT
ncbi:Uncharacterised protein [Mycobacterium tuberculosis]|nr:Uncharacterised protein [Mycobacterium tuberculosis]